jgi:hypothetical protein
MRNQRYYFPNWARKTSYQWYSLPDLNLYLAYQECYIELHTKFSYVPVSHDDFSHLLSSLSACGVRTAFLIESSRPQLNHHLRT